MEPRDLLNPRVFICKAGRFVENVVKKNIKKSDDKPEIVKETYYNKHFVESCDEHDIEKYGIESDDSGSGSGSGDDDCNTFTDDDLNAEVISNGDLVPAKCKTNQTATEGVNLTNLV